MGCTPGYLALIAEILVEAGVREGLTEDQARRMAAKAMSATGKLLDLREPGELKRAVASPGGMTEAGLNELEEHNLREVLQAAVAASLEIARR
jgi:pyrroline-5-carboxylate reductase